MIKQYTKDLKHLTRESERSPIERVLELDFEWLVFAEDWGRHPSSSQHIFRSLIKNNEQIYWVNSIGLRRPRLQDGKRIIEKLKQVVLPKSNIFNQQAVDTYTANDLNRCLHLSPKEVIAPIAISWPGSSLVSRLNRYLLTAQVSKKFAFKNTYEKKCRILWLSLPTARCVVNAFEEHCVVYYAGDDFSALAGVDNNAVTNEESQLVKQADLILAASENIAAKFPQHKTHVINHGVDSQLFSQNCQKPDDFPEGEYTVGYYGSITEWLDFELIEFLAKQNTHVNFIFIGRVICKQADSIFTLSNVFHFPDMPHHQLIEYASNWQVSLMPFLLNEQIRACDPLKLREYLAIGKPILSTSFPALEPFKNVVFQHDSKIEILKKLQDILNLGPAQLSVIEESSRRSVESSSWERRADQIKELITTIIQNKQSKKGSKYVIP